MGVESLFEHNIFEEYKDMEIMCNTKEEWDKGHDEFESMNEEAKTQGYKGVCAHYKGLYVKEMLDNIDENMKEVHRDYNRRSINSEKEAAKIIINT